MRNAALIILFATMVQCSLSAQNRLNNSSIDSILNFYSEYYDFNGSILVTKNGKTLFKKGYGYANFEFGIKTELNSTYHIRSITKGFTNVLIADLLKKGKIKLKDHINVYLPEIEGEIGETVTIKHLLTHQSGIGSIDMDVKSSLTKIDYLKQINKTKLLFPPGTKERYHDFNYYILGVIIERITGQELAQVFKEKIFTPLNMKETGLADGESMIKNLVTPYYLNQVDHGVNYHHVFPRITEVGYAFGGIYSTLDDLYKWIEALHSDKFNTRNINGFVDDKTKNHDTPFGGFPNTIDIKGISKKVYIGDGCGGGYRSLYYYFPDDNLCVIMLSNTYYFKPAYTGGMLLFDKIPYLVSKALFTNNIDLPKFPTGKKLIEKINNDIPIDQIITDYYTYKNKTVKYLMDIKQINIAAYYCLENNKPKEAFDLFKLNMKEYPDSWIVFDGLGEYYFRNGNRKKAIEYFKISIKMNPNSWREEKKMYNKRKNMLEIIDFDRS